MRISLLPASRAASDPACAGMVAAASFDPSICAATYLPPGMDVSEASAFLTTLPLTSWVLLIDGEPAGLWRAAPVTDPCGFALPDGCLELEMWLLPAFRGRRVGPAATDAMMGLLDPASVPTVVGIAWVDNVASAVSMLRSGFHLLGRGWWGGEEDGGMCSVWIRPVTPADGARRVSAGPRDPY